MKFQWKRLYKELDNSRNGSWRQLAISIGVTPSVFTRISQGKPVSVVNLAKLLGVIDSFAYSIKPFINP